MSKLAIWNQALSHIGEGIPVLKEDEGSASALELKRWYDTALEIVLKKIEWGFCERTDELVFVQDAETTSLGFRHIYNIPEDFLKERGVFISCPLGADGYPVPEPVSGPYKIRTYRQRSTKNNKPVRLDPNLFVFTNFKPAWISYTIANPDPKLFSTYFGLALSYKLAEFVAPAISKTAANHILPILQRGYQMAIAEGEREVGLGKNRGRRPTRNPVIESRESFGGLEAGFGASSTKLYPASPRSEIGSGG